MVGGMPGQEYGVLPPVEVGIHQHLFRFAAGQLVEIGQVVGVANGSRDRHPKHQRASGDAGPLPGLRQPDHRQSGHNREAHVNGKHVPDAVVHGAGHGRRQDSQRESPGQPVSCRPALGPAKPCAEAQKEQECEGRLDRQRRGKEVPPTSRAEPAEKVAAAFAGVVAHGPADAIEKLGGGQPHAPPRRRAEGEEVAGPDDQRAHKYRDGQRRRPLLGKSRQPLPAGPFGDHVHDQREYGRNRKKPQRGEFREDGHRGGGSEQQAVPERWLLRPHDEREEGGAKTGGERHVGGGQASVSQHGRQQGEQASGNHRDGIPEIAPGPEIDYQARQDEERQDAEPRQGQGAPGVAAAIQHGHAFENHVGGIQEPGSIQIRSQCGHGARQGWMLRLIQIDMLGHILQAAGEVRRFVEGDAHFRVRRCDPDDRDSDQTHRQDERAAFQKRRGRFRWLRRLLELAFGFLPGQTLHSSQRAWRNEPGGT